ncbi:hypothetical protein LSUCC0031_05415 [Rhodobacterales bacterium LSUCC0031]|nr:hypothetical protein [Rhodobacterales bacterium LSUCC0031]
MTDQPTAGHGVVVRAANGDVIRYDPTGLVMRLSDKVIADIALRLGHFGAQADPTSGASNPKTQPTPDSTSAAPGEDLLSGIDAWGVTHKGDWLHFTARLAGAQGVRGFRRHITGGAILGDGPGALVGILGLGGPRAALANPGAPAFPHHIVSTADDIGAVGMAGIEAAPMTDRLEPLREATHEVLVAETILHWQIEKFAPLPLIFARAETDASASAAALAEGRAVENLLVAAQNLKAAATTMGKKAKIAAICLDYALEHLGDDPRAYRDGMLAVMTRLSDGLGVLGFDKPLFVARFEGGLAPNMDSAAAVIAGQWELAWNHGDHKLIYAAPNHAFPHDAFHRPTAEGRRQMAEMTAHAIAAGESWRCPVLHLAEWEPGQSPVIRVTLQAEGPLILTDASPAGFVLHDAPGITITDVAIAADDPKAVLVHLSGRAPGIRLSYGMGQPGAITDNWAMPSRTGGTLSRHALPAIMPVTGGPQNG